MIAYRVEPKRPINHVTAFTTAEYAGEIVRENEDAGLWERRGADGYLSDHRAELHEFFTEVNRGRELNPNRRGYVDAKPRYPDPGNVSESSLTYAAIQAAILAYMADDGTGARGASRARSIPASVADDVVRRSFPWLVMPGREDIDDRAEREAMEWADAEAFGVDDLTDDVPPEPDEPFYAEEFPADDEAELLPSVFQGSTHAERDGVNPPISPDDWQDDPGGDALRPSRIAEVIGQDRVKGVLTAAVAGARQRKQVLDHILFAGPPGTGKTTLARCIANELHRKAVVTSGPALDRDSLYEFLTALQPGDVFFIDEIHRLPAPVAELLYPAMEDFAVCLPGIPQEPLPPFTLVGATTDPGRLPAPFRDRFGIIERLSYYSVGELARIVVRSARVLGLQIDRDAAVEIATRAQDTPRLANRVLVRCRDFLASTGNLVIDRGIVVTTCDALGIDARGLDVSCRLYLDALNNRFHGGPIGLKTLARAIGAEVRTVEDSIEPFLIRRGLTAISQRGRVSKWEDKRRPLWGDRT